MSESMPEVALVPTEDNLIFESEGGLLEDAVTYPITQKMSLAHLTEDLREALGDPNLQVAVEGNPLADNLAEHPALLWVAPKKSVKLGVLKRVVEKHEHDHYRGWTDEQKDLNLARRKFLRGVANEEETLKAIRAIGLTQQRMLPADPEPNGEV